MRHLTGDTDSPDRPVEAGGVGPREGESIQQLLEAEAFADSLVPAALRPVPLGTVSGPIVLVGHSYGGAVMSKTFAGDVDRHDGGDGGDAATLERRR